MRLFNTLPPPKKSVGNVEVVENVRVDVTELLRNVNTQENVLAAKEF